MPGHSITPQMEITMIIKRKACLLFGGLLTATGALSAGCKDQRIDHTATPKHEVKVDAPGVNVQVDAPAAAPAVPRAANEVDVDVGPGGVQVGVDGEPLRERIRERREEAQEAKP
jgi:hypothetical protein